MQTGRASRASRQIDFGRVPGGAEVLYRAGCELIAGIGAHSAREVVFQFEGVRSAVLPQELGREVIGHIGAGTRIVLWAIESL